MRAMARGLRYERLVTERANRASAHLDRLDARGIAALMNREDARVVRAVARVARDIAGAVNLIVAALRSGGRLIFVGAGTSGRLGVLEAAECPPTFGTPPSLVQGIMAGGRAAVFRSREGAEDDARAGAQAIRARARAGDVVVGVSASGVTPFVRGALTAARRVGAKTVLVTCNKRVAARPSGGGGPATRPRAERCAPSRDAPLTVGICGGERAWLRFRARRRIGHRDCSLPRTCYCSVAPGTRDITAIHACSASRRGVDFVCNSLTESAPGVQAVSWMTTR